MVAGHLSEHTPYLPSLITVTQWSPSYEGWCLGGEHFDLDVDIKGVFFWGYSSYSYTGLVITEYTEFPFRKECPKFWKRNTHGGGDLGPTIPAMHDW